MHEHSEPLALERLETAAELRDLPTHEACLSPLQRVLSFLEANSFFTGVVASSILCVSFLLQNTFNALLLLSYFFLTISVYNMNKLTDQSEDLVNSPETARFAKRNQKAIMLGVIVTYCIALFCAYLCNLYEVGIVLLPLCSGVLYSVRLFGFRLKDVLVMKNAVIAGSFACTAVLMPLASHSEVINPGIHFISFTFVVLLLAYFFFLKILINTVLFDVRDMNGDRLAGIVTVPVSLGKAKTRHILLALNSTFVLWILLAASQGWSVGYLLILAASVGYGYWYIFHICRENVVTRKPFYLMVDGEWTFMAVALALLAFAPLSLSAIWHF